MTRERWVKVPFNSSLCAEIMDLGVIPFFNASVQFLVSTHKIRSIVALYLFWATSYTDKSSDRVYRRIGVQ
jgi:hypothetical protein